MIVMVMVISLSYPNGCGGIGCLYVKICLSMSADTLAVLSLLLLLTMNMK